MAKAKKEYWKPSVTADIVPVNICASQFRDDGAIVNIILIKRSDKSEAYPNCWAFPGGFLDKGESIEQCAERELKEETGLVATTLLPIGVFSKPERDPREQVISNAFLSVFASTPEQPLQMKASDDAKEIGLFKIKGNFNEENGSLDINMKCVSTGDKIAFATKFSRGKFGVIETAIKYVNGQNFTELAFDHAEILARAILKAPDLILPTKTKPIDEEANKKELAEHLAK